ncbi:MULTISPECIES: hypothetical protein [Nocardia]|uniref:hypothetical protein n=1 Tax=Nocardia TaxID=1817 RepID=UPI000D69BEC9|nr:MULTISPECIES: hypothetical protein [Nocardia]
MANDPDLQWRWLTENTDADDTRTWERIELLIRAAAVASLTEAEFVRRLRSAGVAVWASGFDHRVSAGGYVVQAPVGSADIRHDVAIGLDLGLGMLREQWDQGPQAAVAARWQWHGTRMPGDFDRDRIALSHPVMWSRMFSDAAQFTHELRRLPPARAASQWAWASARLSGAFAAWSIRAEPDLNGPFATAALQLRWSASALQPAQDLVVGQRRRAAPNLSRVAFGLTNLDHSADDPTRTLLLVIQLCGALFEIGKAHRRRGELPRAAALEHAAAGLNTVCEQLHTDACATGPEGSRASARPTAATALPAISGPDDGDISKHIPAQPKTGRGTDEETT